MNRYQMVEVECSTRSYALDSERERNTKQIKVVEVIKSMVGI